MSWFKVDDSFSSHPKVKRIPRSARKGAVALWTLVGSHCSMHLTDGFLLADDVLDNGGVPKEADQLVTVRLWHAHGHDCDRCPPVPEGQYLYHDWLDYNPSREKVLAERAAAAERQRRAREKSKESRDKGQSHAVTNGVSHGEVAAVVTVPPTRPDPTPSTSYVDREGGSSVPREPQAHPQAEPSPNCEDHPRGTTDPCGPCGRAKTALADWRAEERRLASVAASIEARDRAQNVRREIDQCQLCDTDGYRLATDGTSGVLRCDHIHRQPGALARARAGIDTESRTA